MLCLAVQGAAPDCRAAIARAPHILCAAVHTHPLIQCHVQIWALLHPHDRRHGHVGAQSPVTPAALSASGLAFLRKALGQH